MPRTRYKSLYQLLGISITISITLPCFFCSSQDEQHYANCSQPFKCGNSSVIGELKYPFWGINRGSYCGELGFELKCLNNVPVIMISTHELQVIGTDPKEQKITVESAKFRGNLCPSVLSYNGSINASIFGVYSGSFFLDSSISFLTILYGCPSQLRHQLGWSGQYSCSIDNSSVDVHFATHTVNPSLTSECVGVVVMPISQENAQALNDNTVSLSKALDKGFELSWSTLEDTTCKACDESGGQCGFEHQFTCYCSDKSYPMVCPQSKPGHHQLTTPIKASVATAMGIVLLVFLIICSKYILQKCKPMPQNQIVEDCLKNNASLVPKRCTYTNIKKITKSFSEKLGEGGYGTVFKGSLQDGRVVAVKVWKQSKGDGQEFLNEVMSISRTSHVNVVPLLGFCFEGHKRALIYEFMPNGSLEKFINENNQLLSTQKLFQIAIGIARGLEYLHRGCNTRIVHFDIKPHNILLDAEFTPKISDFGLAKSLKQKESIVSMSGARGTAGYIAPEVILRSFGGVSHKSDVYSFGMMSLEMVGCKKRPNKNVVNSSEMYFPQWIYKQLEQEVELESDSILNEEEKEMERKMILLGLWCIQTNPLSRPAMTRVVEMLEGKVELLEVPHVPSLASPPRQQQSAEDESSSLNL